MQSNVPANIESVLNKMLKKNFLMLVLVTLKHSLKPAKSFNNIEIKLA